MQTTAGLWRALGPALAAAVSACAWAAPPSPQPLPGVLVFGEEHDQIDQQRQVADEVKSLAATGRLAAVVLEMAAVPHGTAALPRDAGEAAVRDALRWQGWPWDPYAAVVMNAVRAGVPVLGGNLPRAGMRDVMGDAALDTRIDGAARGLIMAAVRSGHCDLLPESQLPAMVRIQIARDRSMAEVVAGALRAAPPGSEVVLLTGAVHASRDRGVPLQLIRHHGVDAGAIRVVVFGGADALQADERRSAAVTPREDPCIALRQRLAAPPAPAASR